MRPAAETKGTPAGTRMTVRDEHGWGGVYWVTVMHEHRRAGVGGTLMRSVLSELAGLPVVLCATAAGPVTTPSCR
ncbi:GNAT family N-acetyltransferase [Actinopolymorpha rutila]|uniref:GNAT family N-acetyltransferase n=1 Tax=Actinopolymorpha rutila TaxID=446787 RepID=UPI003B523299